MSRRRRTADVVSIDAAGPGTIVLDVVQRLAVRYDDAARMIGVSESALRELTRRGRFPHPSCPA